uniref:Uncharacterized protein MANES_01G179900 n=1 Tax=Rhizophora mucronata TaxID=61149 RepID=A0A2P2KKB7_RHIMU
MEDSSEVHSEENTVQAEKNNKRKLKTPAQLIALENFYKEHKYPTEEMKSELAQRIGLTEKQISSWFCHRRLKDNRSLKDETYANGRLDWSSGIIQDHGSGLRQDSCGSTKLGEYRNIDPREVESQRPYGHGFLAADITHDHASRYTGNASGMDNTSSESGSSFRHKLSPQDEGAYDIKVSRYLPQNGVTMPAVPMGATSMGHKPSGYLKVKCEIENAAITAVKKQLGRHYREDGPPLGVEFQSLPSDAFTSPSRNPVNGPFYVGDLAWIHSPDASGVRKQSSLSSVTRHEAPSSWMTSQDSHMEGPKCHPNHGSDSHERKSHHQLKPKSGSYNYSTSNPSRNSPMDSYDDLAGETSVYSSKRNYKLSFKHDMEGIRSDSVSDHHGPDGRINTCEHIEHWSHDDDSSSRKIVQRNDSVSKPSKLFLGSSKSLEMEEGLPCRRMAKVDKHYRETKGPKQYHDPVRVKMHPTESTIFQWEAI